MALWPDRSPSAPSARGVPVPYLLSLLERRASSQYRLDETSRHYTTCAQPNVPSADQLEDR